MDIDNGVLVNDPRWHGKVVFNELGNEYLARLHYLHKKWEGEARHARLVSIKELVEQRRQARNGTPDENQN
jgi:hypothetical protein